MSFLLHVLPNCDPDAPGAISASSACASFNNCPSWPCKLSIFLWWEAADAILLKGWKCHQSNAINILNISFHEFWFGSKSFIDVVPTLCCSHQCIIIGCCCSFTPHVYWLWNASVFQMICILKIKNKKETH